MDPDELERIKKQIYDASNEGEDMFNEEDDEDEDDDDESGEDDESIDDDDEEDADADDGDSEDSEDSAEEKDQSMNEEEGGKTNTHKAQKLDETEFQTKLGELEAQIAENRFQYQCYVDVITLLRDHGELNKLRDYRQKMSEVYPLTENLWLDWIKDESKYMDNEEDRSKIDTLFQRAVQDYLCKC
jgi:hypothetical protein